MVTENKCTAKKVLFVISDAFFFLHFIELKLKFTLADDKRPVY